MRDYGRSPPDKQRDFASGLLMEMTVGKEVSEPADDKQDHVAVSATKTEDE